MQITFFFKGHFKFLHNDIVGHLRGDFTGKNTYPSLGGSARLGILMLCRGFLFQSQLVGLFARVLAW